MTDVIYWDDVLSVVESFVNANEGDESTRKLILSIGCELLDVSEDAILDMLSDNVFKAVNIDWDTDGEDVDLPKEVVIPKSIASDEDAISDYLSNLTGFCHRGFSVTKETDDKGDFSCFADGEEEGAFEEAFERFSMIENVASEPLTSKTSPVLLIYTDGYDIETTWFSSYELAFEAMKKAFEKTKKEILWTDNPHLDLYAGIENDEAYIPYDTPQNWKIVKVDDANLN